MEDVFGFFNFEKKPDPANFKYGNTKSEEETIEENDADSQGNKKSKPKK